jgi:hypothetical protein
VVTVSSASCSGDAILVCDSRPRLLILTDILHDCIQTLRATAGLLS